MRTKLWAQEKEKLLHFVEEEHFICYLICPEEGTDPIPLSFFKTALNQYPWYDLSSACGAAI